MPEIEFSELPEHLRVKLTEKGRKELWHRVDEFGGIEQLSDSFDFSQSKMYNWKNKDLAMPVKFVRRLMGQNATSEIILLKGEGSSGKIENPVFPLEVSNEFLTRVRESVVLNSDEVPAYLTAELSLVKRFEKLLREIGRDCYTRYSRDSRYEIRYPKFLHQIFSSINFEEDLAALIDEKGEVKGGGIIVENRKINFSDFEGRLFSRQKQFQIALEQGDSDKISGLIEGEANKVSRLMN